MKFILKKKKKHTHTLPLDQMESDSVDHAGPPAEVERLQLLGDSLFVTPEVEDLHKDINSCFT